MADHVAVGIVTDHGLILPATNGRFQFISDLKSTHFWFKVVGCHFGRWHQDTVLAGIRLFLAAIEEIGDMGVFFCFCDA